MCTFSRKQPLAPPTSIRVDWMQLIKKKILVLLGQLGALEALNEGGGGGESYYFCISQQLFWLIEWNQNNGSFGFAMLPCCTEFTFASNTSVILSAAAEVNCATRFAAHDGSLTAHRPPTSVYQLINSGTAVGLSCRSYLCGECGQTPSWQWIEHSDTCQTREKTQLILHAKHFLYQGYIRTRHSDRK